MPLRETEALVLRTHRLGEADKIVSLLTRQYGRLRAVASGAQRPKSRYGGTLEPLSYIRLWIFERENRDLLRINSAELAESFFSMQNDYRIQIAAQYVAEAAERFLPEREANERVFRLLLAVLRAIKRSGEVNRPLIYFNYWLLRLGGFLPDFGVCASCGAALGAQGYYSSGAHGLSCSACQLPQESFGLAVSDLNSVTASCQGTLDRWILSGKPPSGMNEVRRFLEALIETQLERKLVTRDLLEGGH
ncbi:MAG: DNA repair protein RecO [Acidobacteria bacterium]|nr:DNA repair protein RecO [Acidobacteriota bacterium]